MQFQWKNHRNRIELFLNEPIQSGIHQKHLKNNNEFCTYFKSRFHINGTKRCVEKKKKIVNKIYRHKQMNKKK